MKKILIRIYKSIFLDWLKIIMILIVAGVLAWGSNAFRSEKLAWFGFASVQTTAAFALSDVIDAYYNGACLIDVRPVEAFQAEHLAIAVHLPLDDFQEHFEEQFEKIPGQGRLILYSTEADRESPQQVRRLLIERGFRSSDIQLFEAGWEALKTQRSIPLVSGNENE